MAEDKKDSKPADKGSSGGGSGVSDHAFLIAFLVILFVLWVMSGGPERNPSSRTNQFMEPIGGINGHRGETYQDSFFGKPGSVTNTLPFLK